MANEELTVKDETDHLRQALEYVKDWRTAVDGGANRGTWAFEMANSFANVLAFEPHAGAYLNLCRTVKNLNNVRCIEQALGEVTGEVGLTCRRKVEYTDAHVDLKGEGTEIVRLDDYRIQDLDFIKLDLEGFELFALRGMTDTLLRCKPVIVIENIPKFERRYDLTPRETLGYLRHLGAHEVLRLPPNRVWVFDK